MRYIVSVALILVAIIHLLPLAGVLGSERLASMYGVTVDDPDMLILMRHRAVLFGILGAFLAVAACVPAMQAGAFAAGFISVISFLGLAWSTGGYNANIGKVVTADVAALAFLVVGLTAHLYLRHRG